MLALLNHDVANAPQKRRRKDKLDSSVGCDGFREEETMDMWDTTVSTPIFPSEDGLLIRAFIGGKKAIQYDALSTSIKALSQHYSKIRNLNIRVEYMDVETMCRLKWKPKDLVDWSMKAHIHIHSAHSNQGLRSHGVSWSMDDLLYQLKHLKFHVGFPSGDQLKCPIFTQEKYAYIKALGDMANNTHVVHLTKSGAYEPDIISSIQSFMDANDEGSGWVLKAPFTTNGESVRFAKTMERMMYFLRAASSKYYGEIPYVLIQACMHNRKEYKVVALGGHPLYIASINGSGGKKCADGVNEKFAEKDELLDFADAAMRRLVKALPYVISDGLFRVDIFQTADGRLVVNEFESLDANFDGSEQYEMITNNFLSSYWSNLMHEKIGLYLKMIPCKEHVAPVGMLITGSSVV